MCRWVSVLCEQGWHLTVLVCLGACVQDSELFELRLQRDQARTQVSRLKERLADLFGPDAADINLPLPPGTTTRTAAGRSSGGGASKGTTSVREAELMSTIHNLKTALEKSTASSTPTTKYMAVSSLERFEGVRRGEGK